MSSGKKNYFRHSVQARKDNKIVEIVSKGRENYFFFFALVEMCAEQALAHPVTPRKFSFHRLTICSELHITNAKIETRLGVIRGAGLMDFEMNKTTVHIEIPSLSKYLGKYDKKASEASVVPPRPPASKQRTPEQKDRAKQIKLAYFATFEQRYGIRPTFGKKEHALVYTLMERIGLKEGLVLAQNYPLYNDPWHVGKKHPFAMLISDLDKVRVELREPKRMLDKRRIEKQIIEADENIELTEEKKRLEQAIENERNKQIR